VNGSYKNLAGAAAARSITSSALQATWQKAVVKAVWKSFSYGLIYNVISNGLNIIQSIIMKNV